MNTKEREMTTELKMREAAFALYEAPFRFDHGYIFDAKGQMVSDDSGEGIIARVRGWGRIGYMENAEALQDECGAMIAEALTQFWNKRAESEPSKAEPVAKVRVTSKGYAMELSTYVAYALPEGLHDLYAAAQPSAQTVAQERELFRQFARKELSVYWLEGEEIPSSMLRLWDVWQARAALQAQMAQSGEGQKDASGAGRALYEKSCASSTGIQHPDWSDLSDTGRGYWNELATKTASSGALNKGDM